MRDKNVDKVPFLLLIPVERRGNVIEKLGEYQARHYGITLDINLRTTFPEIPIPEIPTEDMSEREIEHQISHNSDIKARMK